MNSIVSQRYGSLGSSVKDMLVNVLILQEGSYVLDLNAYARQYKSLDNLDFRNHMFLAIVCANRVLHGGISS